MTRRMPFVPVPGTVRGKFSRGRATCVAVLVFTLLLFSPQVSGENLVLGNFSAGDLTGWNPKIFKGETSYTLVSDGDRRVLKAHSRAAASGLYKEVTLNPRKFPVLRWSWKIGGTIRNGNERTKEGDDYAARVYLVFPRTLFWRTKAINYIWANTLPKGESLPNAFTANAMMIAVESGDENAGSWVTEERNVYEDYRRLFGEEPPEIGAVALMTDTDNTGGEATAYYGDITLGSLSSP
ncbi:MAG: DUF3047 domain-containing protein [Candidatus Deferrimicrobiaceae bacterium]